MNNANDLLLEKGKNPLVQAGLVIVANFLITTIGLMIGSTGLLEISSMFPWLSAASFLLLFAIFNSVLSLLEDDTNKYWGRSMSGFMLIAVINGVIAMLFSGIKIFDAGSAVWIYIVIALGYLVFLGIVITMKNIVAFAQHEEWNQPRRRHRRRKK